MGTTATVGTPAPTVNVGIGSISGGINGTAIATIEEVRIYNRALSALEVQQLYTDPFCMFEQRSYRWYVPVVSGGSFFFARQ